MQNLHHDKSVDDEMAEAGRGGGRDGIDRPGDETGVTRCESGSPEDISAADSE